MTKLSVGRVSDKVERRESVWDKVERRESE